MQMARSTTATIIVVMSIMVKFIVCVHIKGTSLQVPKFITNLFYQNEEKGKLISNAGKATDMLPVNMILRMMSCDSERLAVKANIV